jgi:hypothetical protein
MLENCCISFEVPGEIRVSERGKKNENGLWDSIELVEVYVDEGQHVSISIDCTDNVDGISIGLSAHHIENEESGRAFHPALDAHLDWTATRQLRDFLSLLLTMKDDIDTPKDKPDE